MERNFWVTQIVVFFTVFIVVTFLGLGKKVFAGDMDKESITMKEYEVDRNPKFSPRPKAPFPSNWLDILRKLPEPPPIDWSTEGDWYCMKQLNPQGGYACKGYPELWNPPYSYSYEMRPNCENSLGAKHCETFQVQQNPASYDCLCEQ